MPTALTPAWQTLSEETMPGDQTSRIMRSSLAEYHGSEHLDLPVIDVVRTYIPDGQMPISARGIGEMGITRTGAVIANAAHDPTGIRVRDLPITPDKPL